MRRLANKFNKSVAQNENPGSYIVAYVFSIPMNSFLYNAQEKAIKASHKSNNREMQYVMRMRF